MTAVEEVVAAIRAGRPVVLPTDTVYGLCTTAYREEAIRRLQRLKGRVEDQPIALLVAGVDSLLELLPELRGRSAMIARALLPGPYTLVFPNPARRFPWLAGERPDTIGVRVPPLEGSVREVLERVWAVAATSANAAGGQDPRTLAEVPDEIRAGCAALLDGGTLPGAPSTVIDFTGPEPRVLREGAGPVEPAYAALGAAGAPAQ